MVSLPAIVQTPGGLLPGHFVKGRDSSSCVSHLAFLLGTENLESLESRSGILMGGEDSCEGFEAIVPCWALSPGGGGSRGPGCRRDAEGAETRSRDQGGTEPCFLSEGGPPPPPHGRGLRCVPGSVSISLWRGVLKNRLHHPLLLVGGCPALHAFCGLTGLVPTPPVPLPLPLRVPGVGPPWAPAAPSPGLASTSPLSSSCSRSLICIPGSIRELGLSPFYI